MEVSSGSTTIKSIRSSVMLSTAFTAGDAKSEGDPGPEKGLSGTMDNPSQPGGPTPGWTSTRASKKFSAVQAELELIGAAWERALTVEHPDATTEQLQALLAMKLQEASDLIPPRQAAEKKFKDSHALTERTLSNLIQNVTTIQGKTLDDPSARVEYRQAQIHIHSIESARMPELEERCQAAAQVFYKPGIDPILDAFANISNKFTLWVAQLEVEKIDRRPLQKLDSREDREEAAVQLMITQDTKTIITFDAAKFISLFHGDLREPDVLVKFSNWRSSWLSSVQEMETLRGFDNITLFQKLKDCLAGPALAIASKYSARSQNSYEAAMKDLLEKFEDPVELAGSYISSAVAAHH